MKYVNEKKTHKGRMAPFLAMLIVAVLIMSGALIKYQIVDGAYYYEQSLLNNTTKETVAAARGEILDRYGRVLATNKLSLELKITGEFENIQSTDTDERKNEIYKEGNDEILELVNVFNQSGVAYIDDFPISLNNASYTFTVGKEAEADKLKSVLSAQSYATAQNCIDILKDKYNIEGYSDADTLKIASIRAQMLMSDYSSANPYIFAKDLDSGFASRIMEMSDKFKGVETQEVSERVYPSGDIAPHIIGTVGPIYAEDYQAYKDKGYSMNAIVGKSGIESAMEDQLRGIDGKQTVVSNKQGQVMDRFFYDSDKPRPGNSVVLSIDSNFQKQLQDALAGYVKSVGGKGAGLSVIDVKTGETLALVSYPGYDINDFSTQYDALAANPLKPLTNRAIMGLYRPGSSFKTFMSAAGMLNGTFTTNTYYNCVNPFPGTDMTCLQSHHSGPTNIYTALQYSCNNFFYYVAKNMQIDKIDEYAPKFGFATDTGLEITNSNGRVTNPDYYRQKGMNYYVGYTYQTGIGQAEVMVTPLQMSISMMTIANHGTRYAAHLIKSVEKYDFSSNVSTTAPVVMSTLPDDNNAFSVTMSGMKLMAQTRSALSGLDIAAKSGSPQYDDSNKSKTNAAGVGIYPASNPEIGIGIMIEDGKSAQDFFADVVRIYESCKSQQVETPTPKNELITN